MRKLGRHISRTQIRYGIPTLLWLRLKWLCRHEGSDMLEAVCDALRAGLDELDVPAHLDELLSPEVRRRGNGEGGSHV